MLVVYSVDQFLPLYFKTVFCCNHLFVCAQCAMQEKLVCTWATVGECRDFPSCTACGQLGSIDWTVISVFNTETPFRLVATLRSTRRFFSR